MYAQFEGSVNEKPTQADNKITSPFTGEQSCCYHQTKIHGGDLHSRFLERRSLFISAKMSQNLRKSFTDPVFDSAFTTVGAYSSDYSDRGQSI